MLFQEKIVSVKSVHTPNESQTEPVDKSKNTIDSMT